MKGQPKSRIKNIKQFFSRALEKMIGDSNESYKEKVKNFAMPGTPAPKIQRRKSAKKYWYPKPNPARRARKTLNGEIKHLAWPRGAAMPKAPTIDQTRRLEQRIGLKVRVKEGKCFVGRSQLEVPVNATLEECQALLDEYIHKIDAPIAA